MKPNLLKNVYATIATLFVAMFALPTTVQAQALGMSRIILEAHNVWKDGSGYQMLLDANHNLYGDKIPTSGPIWDDANPPADLYNDFEYKIPANADPSTTPQYMVVDGEDYVDIPAGIYDFCIAAPEANKKIWIAGDADGPTRGDDYNFEAGKTYRFTMHIVESANNDGARLTITEGGAAAKYELWIGGTQATSENSNALPTASGLASYDPFTKTLALDEAVINASGEEEGIKSKIDGLTIRVSGDNIIVTGGFSALKTEVSHTTITGAGKLALSANDFGLYAMSGGFVTIENCEIDCDGSFGTDNNNVEVTINNSTITAKGKTFETMRGIQKLTLNGCAITEPEGAVYDPKLGGIALNGQLVKDKVVIKADPITEYDLAVSGVKLTSANYNDISKFIGVSGTVTFDPENKVLTLQNATINAEGYNAIMSNIEGLTVKVVGNNDLNSKYATVSFTAPMTITGGGTANVKSEGDCAIYANGTDCTIENCTVNVKSGAYAIAGNNGTSEKFTVKNATVTAEGIGNGSICDLAELIMVGCKITQPAGAAFDPSMHCVALNGEVVKAKVVITDPTAIETPTADTTATTRGTYTISGVRLSGEQKDLPKGVYIVNGKKVVKQ